MENTVETTVENAVENTIAASEIEATEKVMMLIAQASMLRRMRKEKEAALEDERQEIIALMQAAQLDSYKMDNLSTTCKMVKASRFDKEACSKGDPEALEAYLKDVQVRKLTVSY